jgi:hypothetical protein
MNQLFIISIRVSVLFRAHSAAVFLALIYSCPIYYPPIFFAPFIMFLIPALTWFHHLKLKCRAISGPLIGPEVLFWSWTLKIFQWGCNAVWILGPCWLIPGLWKWVKIQWLWIWMMKEFMIMSWFAKPHYVLPKEWCWASECFNVLSCLMFDVYLLYIRI